MERAGNISDFPCLQKSYHGLKFRHHARYKAHNTLRFNVWDVRDVFAYLYLNLTSETAITSKPLISRRHLWQKYIFN